MTLKRLLLQYALRPRPQRFINARGTQNARSQSHQVFPQMITVFGTEQRGGMIDAPLRLLPLVEKVIGKHHAAGHVSPGGQTPVLREFRPMDRIFRVQTRVVGLQCSVRIFAELLVHTRVFRNALQRSGARHMDVVVLVARQLIRFQRLLACKLEVPAIQMQISRAHQH